jgi:hypothetical protein
VGNAPISQKLNIALQRKVKDYGQGKRRRKEELILVPFLLRIMLKNIFTLGNKFDGNIYYIEPWKYAKIGTILAKFGIWKGGNDAKKGIPILGTMKEGVYYFSKGVRNVCKGLQKCNY